MKTIILTEQRTKQKQISFEWGYASIQLFYLAMKCGCFVVSPPRAKCSVAIK